jgi:hypothetical protein
LVLIKNRFPSITDKEGISHPGAWAFSVPKRFIKKIEKAQTFNKYLIEQNDLGTITRQEEVNRNLKVATDGETDIRWSDG